MLQAADPRDRDAVLRLLEDSVPAFVREAVRDPLLRALAGDAPFEERCLVTRGRSNGAITGFVLYGFVAGAQGAGRIRAAAVTPLARRRGVGRELLEGAVADLHGEGARLVIAEVPDLAEMHYFDVLLGACAFVEEGRIPDMVRAGVAMRYLVRRLAPHADRP